MAGTATSVKRRASKIARANPPMGFVKAVARRYWDGDGPSHTRGLAYYSMLVLLAGFIGFLGLTSVLESRSLRGAAQEMVRGLSPGPSGEVLREAAQRGSRGGSTAMALGFIAAVTAGTRGMRQVERAANRMFGVEKDRPFVRRYAVALGLALSAGSLLTLGALGVASGEAISRGAGIEGGAEMLWAAVRWPAGIALVGAALYLVYRVAPRRRPGTPRHLLLGVAAALALWVLFTALLVLYFSVSDRAVQTYGPLVGIVALLLWSAFTSVATILGLVVIAELAEGGSDSSKRSA